MTAALVLASGSPRRRELLRKFELCFEVLPSNVPEKPGADESPKAFAARTAREKASSVGTQRSECWVLAADTVVVCEGEILGKPATRGEARRMLRSLSGRTHQVLTAVALRAPFGTITEQILVESEVTFHPLSGAEIDAYLDSGEPFDKAGAYAVQGEAARFVVQVAGSYTNVVGLPVDEVGELLRRHGLLAATDRSESTGT